MDNENRIVVLIDMDCFYCQVEEKLNPDLIGKPIAVVQYNPWKGGGIIAVNYVARSMGVTRHMRGDEAKEKCPDIQLPSVPCLRGKADISKYREAGKDVAKVLQKFTPLLERASIDEAYLDITTSVQEKAKSLNTSIITKDMIPNTFALGYDSVDEFIADVHNYGSESLEFDYNNAKQLLIGSLIVSEIRTAVFKETGYRCSAGIAHNKILAKLVCGMNKPDKQTVLPKHSVDILYSTLSIKKVKSLGGKFGDTVCESLKIKNMSQLQSFTLKELQNTFDEKNGLWLYNIARGIDLEPVQARFNPKSIGCCKQLRGKSALVDLDSLKKWLTDLGDEIEGRLDQDSLENNRTPKQMVVSFATSLKDGRDISSSRSYNFLPDDELCGELFMTKALELIMETAEGTKINGDENNRKLKAPIKFLGISVGKFEDASDSKKTKKIVDYFACNSAKEPTHKTTNQPNVNEIKTENKGELNKGKEYILDKFLTGTYTENSSPFVEANSVQCNKNNKEPTLEKKVSFFAQLLKDESKRSDNINTPKSPQTEPHDDKTVHPTTSICDIVHSGEDSIGGTDYSGSTINMEINKSIALFEDSDHELDRINNMRQLLNSRTIFDNDNDTLTQNDDTNVNSVRESVANTHTIVNNVNRSEKNIHVGERSVNNSNGKYHCPLCNKSITIDKIDMHSDYHLALQIRDEERKQAHSNRIVTKSSVNGESNKKTTVDNLSSQKKDYSSIAGFLVKLDNTIPTESCSVCRKKVPMEKMSEHMDFHEAQKLSRELNHKSIYQNESNVKRKRVSTSPVQKPKVQCKSIDSYFR